jgi:transcriptional regulator with XRE-family HTH domain
VTADGTRNYSELVRRVRIRRSELGLTVYGLAEKAGMSKDTFMKVEDGRAARDSTYIALDKVLGWPPGTCVSVLEDAGAINDENAAPTRPITEEDISQALLAGVVAHSDLPAPQIRAIRDAAIGDLKRRGLL